MKKTIKKAGFTLIEILVVLAILGTLYSLASKYLLDKPEKANISKAKMDISTISNALEMYKIERGDFPKEDDGIRILIENINKEDDWSQSLKKLPKDPWGNEYIYKYPGEKTEFDLYTLGKDGKEGGEDENATIGNWQ